MTQNNNENNREFSQTEIHLRRLTIDEATYRLDSFLNDAFMAGQEQLKVIHGKGTGTLKEAVHQYLDAHSLVLSHRMGLYDEGGDGVTIVQLAPRKA
ncbi:MAG: Smr/MutS family protein [Chloroflexi bacterium]|nr:Smr/MutS family protein [Chloroflexota bacterium]